MSERRVCRRRRVSAQTVFLLATILAGVVVLGYIALPERWRSGAQAQAQTSRLALEDIPFDGAGAYRDLERICALGRRPSGSEGMAAQQKLLEEHFTALGGKVRRQEFRARHPQNGEPLPMTNLIVQWQPDRKRRILLCTHYDTLPFPMLDRENPRGVFVGANDGASGVALLMELGRQMPGILRDEQKRFGVDFVFFDGEEFIFDRRDPFFLGSTYFARAYAAGNLPYAGRYRWGVLLDMIGDADLQLYQERNSMWWKDTRPLVGEIWATAHRLGVREFVPRKGHELLDDHVPLHNTGGIPVCDVIDFDYPPWHTRGDVAQKCSALSLAKVGWVIREWLKAAD